MKTIKNLLVIVLFSITLLSCKKEEPVTPSLSCEQVYDKAMKTYTAAYQRHEISESQWKNYCNDAKEDYEKCKLN